MRAIIYRRTLSITSGAGKLIAVQAQALRGAGFDTRLACQRGAWRYWMRGGLRAHTYTADEIRQVSGTPECLVIDHAMELPGAQIVFSHNLMSQARRFMERPEMDIEADRERQFFAALNSEALVVANSMLVREAIREHFEFPQDRLRLCYPGIRTTEFSAQRRTLLRAQARRALGLRAETPLVGFVTSGDLHKRGMGIFLDTAAAMLAERPDLRFLVVGSRVLPSWMRRHALLASGTVLHRGRGRHPAKWMAALDVFLYPARFEEFGMVVMEACALGVPVITSRRVGAAECLPEPFAPWICAVPEAEQLADSTLRLLADETARSRLSAAGIEAAARFGEANYAADSLAIVASRTETAA